MVGTFTGQESDLEQFVLSSAKTFSKVIVGELSDLVRDVFMWVADFLVIVFTLFFFFKDGRYWLASLYGLIPLDASHKDKVLVPLDQTIRAVVKGVVLTAVAQGLLAGAAYAVLGVPFPMVLMALTILLAPLPFGGTALILGPVAGYLLWSGTGGKGVGDVGLGNRRRVDERSDSEAAVHRSGRADSRVVADLQRARRVGGVRHVGPVSRTDSRRTVPDRSADLPRRIPVAARRAVREVLPPTLIAYSVSREEW